MKKSIMPSYRETTLDAPGRLLACLTLDEDQTTVPSPEIVRGTYRGLTVTLPNPTTLMASADEATAGLIAFRWPGERYVTLFLRVVENT